MDIRIFLLGDLGARFGREHRLEFSEGLTAGEVRHRLIERIEGSAAALSASGVRIAVDQTVVPDSTCLAPGQEVALLPVFSGG